MLRPIGGIHGGKFNEWKAFYELDPDDDRRTEFGLARLYQVLTRSQRPLGELLLPFGDRAQASPVKQSIEYQEMVIDAWCAVTNAIHDQKKGGVNHGS